MKKLYLVLLLLVVFSSFSQSTTFFILRHAEKENSGKDPNLSSDGLARAETLRNMLENVVVNAVYSTPYNRTKQTVAPLATEKEIAVIEYPANKPSLELVKEILDTQKGKTIVIVGHSNTVPEILKVLSKNSFNVNISESQFDNLYIVTLLNDGNATVLPLQYGKRTP